MGFALYLKTFSLVSIHPNVLKLGKAGNSGMLFHVMKEHAIFLLGSRPLLVSKVAN